MRIHRFIFLLLLLAISPVQADEIRVAVASNFLATAKKLTELFEQRSAHRVLLSSSSTGKHYAQIIHGAPYELFLAADTARPHQLEQQGKIVAGTRFTYALGKLVLWSSKRGYVDAQGEILNGSSFAHLAIANPKLAPYGEAAREVLQKRKQWQALQDKLVLGENIGQTLQFVLSGNAELGFVAYSQIKHSAHNTGGSYWLIPRELYTPIHQQAVLLRDTPAARALLVFLQSPEALKIIHDHGYDSE